MKIEGYELSQRGYKRHRFCRHGKTRFYGQTEVTQISDNMKGGRDEAVRVFRIKKSATKSIILQGELRFYFFLSKNDKFDGDRVEG